MKPLNVTLGDAFRYQRHLVTDEEIQAALDLCEEMLNATGELDPTNIAEESQILKDFKDENEDTIKEAEAAIAFVADIKRVYEDRFGRIFDTPLDTLVQWIHDDLQRVPEEDKDALSK